MPRSPLNSSSPSTPPRPTSPTSSTSSTCATEYRRSSSHTSPGSSRPRALGMPLEVTLAWREWQGFPFVRVRSDVRSGSALRSRREHNREHGVAGLAEHEAPREEADDSQRDQQRGPGEPLRLKPLDPLGAPVTDPSRSHPNKEAREDRQPHWPPYHLLPAHGRGGSGRSHRRRLLRGTERITAAWTNPPLGSLIAEQSRDDC